VVVGPFVHTVWWLLDGSQGDCGWLLGGGGAGFEAPMYLGYISISIVESGP